MTPSSTQHLTPTSCDFNLQVSFWGTVAAAVTFFVAAFHKHVAKWIIDLVVRRRNNDGPEPGLGELPPQPRNGNGPQAPAVEQQPPRGPQRRRQQ